MFHGSSLFDSTPFLPRERTHRICNHGSHNEGDEGDEKSEGDESEGDEGVVLEKHLVSTEGREGQKVEKHIGQGSLRSQFLQKVGRYGFLKA